MMMESLILNLQSKNQILDYIADNHLVPYEKDIFQEIINLIESGDQTRLDWYRNFGDSLRAITMNVQGYRKGLEFGFTEVVFDKYGWLGRPEWLDKEELNFGDTSRYGNYSSITLGKGANGTWTYAISYSYGLAGGGYGLSVYGQQFKNRMEALGNALRDLKYKMSEKIGSTDTTNDKQPIILATLRDIEEALINMVQLSLF